MRPSSSRQIAPVGIVAALAAEARQLGPALRRGDALALADGTRLAVTGVGREAAAEGARWLVAAGCRSLASWGLAGGLDPALAAGHIVLPEEVVLDGGESLATARAWRERVARSLEAAHWPAASGKLLTSARTLETVAVKSSAFRGTRAVAVDMESFAIAQVAAAGGIPFIAVRAIVDTAADEVPPALASAADAAGAISAGRIVARLVLRPTQLPALLRLAARYRAAARSLRAVAATGALTASSV
jgi:adenosylhomocysteine nucleosidase